jgi:glycosyltransferase involved in cell wall biosynthesis
VVNSPWSLRCLQREGVPEHKFSLIPLVYEPDPAQRAAEFPIPLVGFDGPFQLLFLGTIGLRKGIARLLDAMRLLETQPVQLTLAGPSELDPQAWAAAPNIRWLGPVLRSQVAAIYGQAHAILPQLKCPSRFLCSSGVAHFISSPILFLHSALSIAGCSSPIAGTLVDSFLLDIL